MNRLIFLLAIALAAFAGRSNAQQASAPIPAPTPRTGIAMVLLDIPSPVVGSTTSTAQSTPYVFPDAFNIENYATDDRVAGSDLRWSYEVVGSAKYLINGVPPINSAVIDPTIPPTNLTINQTVANGESNPDGQARTITVRNQRLYPLGGTPAKSPGFTGIGDIQPVTFWCSNGTTASHKNVFFYTKSDGSNYLSQKSTYSMVKHFSFPAWDSTWKIQERGGPFGNVTTGTFSTTGAGLCFNVTLSGDNYASIAQNAPTFTLTPNMAYRFRMRMNSSQVTPGKTPLWDFVVENYPAAGQIPLNLYGMDAIFYDNGTGANSVLQTQGGTWVNLYWTPLPVLSAQWDTNLFYTPQYSSRKDARVRFRVMDVDSAGILANMQFGQICMQELVIESIPLTKFTSNGPDLVSLGSGTGRTKFAPPNPAGTGNIQCESFMNTMVMFNADGSVTLTPNKGSGIGDGTNNEIAYIFPQKNSQSSDYDSDRWPIPWNSAELLELQVDAKAPTAADQANPWDAMWLDMTSPTNEVNCESYVTANKALGSPTTTAETYTFLYWTQNKTLMESPPIMLAALRWRVRFGNATSLLFPNGQTRNTGAVTVTGINLRKLNVPY